MLDKTSTTELYGIHDTKTQTQFALGISFYRIVVEVTIFLKK